jgi:hypothetical protein
MTAAAVGCSLLVGEDRQARRVRLGADLIARHLPAWQEKEGGNLSTINFYYWYFGTLALSRLGGPEFRRWQEEVDRVLTASQRQESGADEEGSWDPVDEWGPAGGRVYSTALAVMTLAIGPGE